MVAVDIRDHLRAYVPPPTRTHTLATLPPGVAGLVWQNLTPVEQHYLGVTCRGALADRVSVDGQKRGDFLREINVFFSFARENFQANVAPFEECIAVLTKDLTLINKGKKLKKIYVEFLNLFLSLSNEDLAKTDGIDHLPLSDLKGEIFSALAIASWTRAALPFAQGIAGIANINEILTQSPAQYHAILRKEIKVYEFLIVQSRYSEAIEFVDKLPDLNIEWKRRLKKRGLHNIFNSLSPVGRKYLDRVLQIIDGIITNYIDVGDEPPPAHGILYHLSNTISHFLSQLEIEDKEYLDSWLEPAKKFWKKGHPKLLETLVSIFSKRKSFDRAIEILDILGPGPLEPKQHRCWLFLAVMTDLCNLGRFDEAKMVSNKMFCVKKGTKLIFIRQHPVLERISKVFCFCSHGITGYGHGREVYHDV